LLLMTLMALFVFVGYSYGGHTGMIYAFGAACVLNLVAYWFSDKMVLAAYRATPATEKDHPKLVKAVRALAIKAGIPEPRVYIIASEVPNAFATGRNPQNAAIAATTGILERLNDRELEGVLGHELSHVLHRDILISTIAATFAGAIMTLASMARWGALFGGGSRGGDNRRGGGFAMIAVMILAPLAATLIQMAVSRSREYDADRQGAELTGDPLSLASALRKIAVGNAQTQTPLTTNPATAHLFICSTLSGQSMASLFATHPPMETRIQRLESMTPTGSFSGSSKISKLIY